VSISGLGSRFTASDIGSFFSFFPRSHSLVPPSKKGGKSKDGDDNDITDLTKNADEIMNLIEQAGRAGNGLGADETGMTAAQKAKARGGATQTGIVIAALQERLKKARIVYGELRCTSHELFEFA
jgi:hypothetical protein